MCLRVGYVTAMLKLCTIFTSFSQWIFGMHFGQGCCVHAIIKQIHAHKIQSWIERKDCSQKIQCLIINLMNTKQNDMDNPCLKYICVSLNLHLQFTHYFFSIKFKFVSIWNSILSLMDCFIYLKKIKITVNSVLMCVCVRERQRERAERNIKRIKN